MTWSGAVPAAWDLSLFDERGLPDDKRLARAIVEAVAPRRIADADPTVTGEAYALSRQLGIPGEAVSKVLFVLHRQAEAMLMPFEQDDGGRAQAGFKGETGDCACRAVAIAAAMPYAQVYEELTQLGRDHERPRKGRKRSHARTGVHRKTLDRYLKLLGGWEWVATMAVGAGTQVHLRRGELPEQGRLIARVSRHFVAVVDGTLRDTHDPSRGGTRCVYGYWRQV